VEDAAEQGFRVATRRIADPLQARAAAEAEAGAPVAVWARGEDVMTAHGVAARLEFTGRDRVPGASAAWRALTAAAVVDDAAGVPGSGLIAFGAFAFADDSAAVSTLIVPRRVVGVRDGTAFVTEVTGKVSRPDVAAAYGVAKARGYSVVVPRGADVCAFGIDTTGNAANPLLGCRTP